MFQLFHTLNRGVDKRKIFLDNQDYFRFIHDLYEFNDEDWVNTTFYRFSKSNDIASRKITPGKQKRRKLLVDIHAFCLMPNHYHLLLSPRNEKAIPLFMKKVNMGYTKYFNEKYKRTGTLWEKRYKSISVNNEPHFSYLPYYIHSNPLDLIAPEWRQGKINNPKGALKFLNNYRWSSHLDYCGKPNFPSLTNRKFLLGVFQSEQEYEKSINKWFKNMSPELISESVELFLEPVQ